MEKITPTTHDNWFEFAKKIYISKPLEPFNFSDVKISSSIRHILKHDGITSLFAFQAKVLEYAQRDTDLYTRKPDIGVCAPTGSGKTLCYALPIVELHSREPLAFSVIIVPFLQLSTQIVLTLKNLCRKTNIEVTSSKNVTSKDNVIWVLTPLQFKEFLTENVIKIPNLRFLVFDEADKLYNQKHGEWQKVLAEKQKNIKCSSIEDWLQGSHPTPQKMVLSATLNDDPQLIRSFDLFNPVIVVANSEGGNHINPNLRESFLICDPEKKPLFAINAILSHTKKADSAVLCFANSSNVVKRLFQLMSQHSSLKVAKHSAEMKEVKRNRSVKRLLAGECNVMVATDSLSRGVDFKRVGLVINYDCPRDPTTYLHRVGRTTRGTAKGKAITIITEGDDIEHIKSLKRKKEFKLKKEDESKINHLKKWYEESIEKLTC